MAEYILMTALSPTMDEGIIAKWTVKEGDTISSGDVICEVETDKATMDYESTQEGTLLKILVGAGANAAVGVPIGIIGSSKDDVSQLITDAKQSMMSNIEEKQHGNSEQKKGAEDTTKLNSYSKQNSQQLSSSNQSNITPIDNTRVLSSPLARKVASDNGLAISSISGSGPKGRVVLEDVKQKMASSQSMSSSQEIKHQTATSLPVDNIVVPVSGVRKVIAKRLTDSKFSAPHFYLTISIDMQTILDARSALNLKRKKQNKPKITLNSYLIKIVAEALARNPALNSTWRDDDIMQYGSVDIGLAVDGKAGLITPIVRNCSRRGLLSIDDELQSLIQQAREGSLKPEQYSGATFTISNLGSFGIESFTAIINPPGCAILAIGQTISTPMVNESREIVVKNIMKVTLTCDHRVVDGALAAKFLSTLKNILENPIQLLY